MSDQPQRGQDLEMVEKHVQALIEHFDSVQIFVSRYNPNGLDEIESEGTTTWIQKGRGNYFSRYGQVKHWLVKEEAATAKEGGDQD
jgi:hypothetical protein